MNERDPGFGFTTAAHVKTSRPLSGQQVDELALRFLRLADSSKSEIPELQGVTIRYVDVGADETHLLIPFEVRTRMPQDHGERQRLGAAVIAWLCVNAPSEISEIELVQEDGAPAIATSGF